MRRPAAATMPTTARAGSDSAPSRVARISCSVDGSRALPWPVSARTSSSMKNGLPSERRWKRDATDGRSAPPRVIDVEHRGGLVGVEAREVDPADPARPLELG